MHRVSILLAVFCAAVPLCAQEPVEKPTPTGQEKPELPPKVEVPAKPESPAKPELPAVDPAKPGSDPVPSLLPADVPTNLKPAESRIKNRTTLKAPETSVDLDLRIRYRQAHTKASADAKVQAAWAESRAAATDYNKRAAMRRYYALLFQKMTALDKGITPLVTERSRFTLHKLDQTRIDPTDPIIGEETRE